MCQSKAKPVSSYYQNGNKILNLKSPEICLRSSKHRESTFSIPTKNSMKLKKCLNLIPKFYFLKV